MTCVIGLVHGGKVYMAADSASGQDDSWQVRKTLLHKVFQAGEFLIGYTTSFRMGQLLQYNFHPMPQPEGQADLEYMATAFIDAVRAVMKTGGLAEIDKGVESAGSFMVGYRGSLYTVGRDYQVNQVADGFDSIGSGSSYALGAMLALADKPPPERLLCSLECAAALCGNVCGPFIIKTIGG